MDAVASQANLTDWFEQLRPTFAVRGRPIPAVIRAIFFLAATQ
jgi:hypothetical protein